MIPLLQFNRKLQYLFIALLLASFAIAQSGKAVTPEPDLGTGEPSIATGLQASEFHPNRRAFRFLFQEPLQCAGGMVTMVGLVEITFHNNVQRRFLKPRWIKVASFDGTARSDNRKLTVASVDLKDVTAGPVCGCGSFNIEMIVTGPALPGGSPLRLKVLFGLNEYTFQNGLVTGFTPERTPKVNCINP